MKVVTHYICDLCRTEYNDERKAKACEGRHAKKLKVHSKVYRPFLEDGFPEYVVISSSDSAVHRRVKYKRCGVVEEKEDE